MIASRRRILVPFLSGKRYNGKRVQAMTITVKLKPEVETGFLTQASGMTIEDYLLSLVEGAVILKTQDSSSSEERRSI
jgi:hypothetical protein